MDEYQPDAVILPEPDDQKRCQRIRNLIRQIARKARANGMEVAMVTTEQVQRRFAPYGATTKCEIAKLIAEWYPPLETILPKPRKPWESENIKTKMFEAAALAHFVGSEISI